VSESADLAGERALSRVVVVGLGGIGGWLLRLLMPFLHSRRQAVTVLAVDGDTFELRNLSRMAFEELGPKAVVLCDELACIYEGVVSLVPVPAYVDRTNVGELIVEGDVVFCQPDNHATRRLVDERCAMLSDVVLFSSGNEGVNDDSGGTFGNVQVYLREGGSDVTNRITRFHPEISEATDPLPTEAGCGAVVADNPQLVFTNASVAAASLAAFYAWLTRRLAYEECYLDILAGRTASVSRKRWGGDGLCGDSTRAR
jgi:molybdopterin/thiamine biosynthesis adenylyltransferase